MTGAQSVGDDGGSATSRARVVAAARLMESAGGPVPLAVLAESLGCSERHVTRCFREVLDVSPREYGEAVRTGNARALLRNHETIADAVYAAGYGSQRAFYEQTGRRLGMPPLSYARGGEGRELVYSSAAVTIGGHRRSILAVASHEGLCAVRMGSDVASMLDEVRAELPGASISRDDDALEPVMLALVALARGEGSTADLPLDVRGTAFQARVWQALVQIPRGETRSYSEVAEQIGQPTAVRAVARACATNPVALVVPCHRVVRSDGSPSGYRWGLELKVGLLAAEGRPSPPTGTMVG